MVTEKTREQTWVEYWDAERKVRYCEMTHKRYQRRHISFTLLLAISACGGVISFIQGLSEETQLYINAIVPAIAICSLLLNDAKKAAIIYTLGFECSRIRDSYRKLWLQIENQQITNDEVLSELQKLRDDYADAEKASGDHDILINNRKNKKAAEIASKVMANRYNVRNTNNVTAKA